MELAINLLKGVCRSLKRARTGLIVAYCLIVLVGTLSPFNFTTDRNLLMNRAEPIEWIPFSYICPRCGFNIKNKVLNLGMLGPLGLLLVLPRRRDESGSVRIFKATLWCLIFSVLIETSQYFLPARTPSASDVLMNTIGAFLGAVVALIIWKWWENKR